MANKRHPKHDQIVDEICKGTVYKQIAHQFGISLNRVEDIAANWTRIIRVPKKDAGEGQKSFWRFWQSRGTS